MRTILLIMIGLSGFLLADLRKSGDVVTDIKTCLVWQDNNDTNETIRTWQESIDYCEALNLGGESDWRLPNINELKTIVDRSKTQPAIVDGLEYVGIDDGLYGYWSSSTFNGDENDAWLVVFYDSDVYWGNKDASGYVRCVRDGQ